MNTISLLNIFAYRKSILKQNNARGFVETKPAAY